MKYISLIVLFCLTTTLFAQEIKFGDVTKEELLETSYENDPSADAVVLYKNQNTYFISTGGVSQLITEIHERIKIYNKDGFDYATEYINLFKAGSSNEKVSKIKATTYNLENDKIVETDLDRDQIFETEVSFNYDEVKFTMPNVKEGSVIEYRYKITSPFIGNIDEFRFQYDIPIKTLIAEIRTPKGVNYKQTYKGFLRFNTNRSVKTDNRLGMAVNIDRFTMSNVPAMKEEGFVDNINNYRSGVMFELVSIDLPNYYRSYSQTWGDVAKTIGNTDDYKKELDKTKSFDEELDELIAGQTSDIEKMKTIYKYVKDNVTWNGIDGKYFYNGLKKTLKEKKGNAADINLLLVAMLRYAGLYANPVIISTKDNAIPMFPTVDRLNYVIAYVVSNDEKYFLDATEEFSDINVLPIKDYNWRGILIDNENMRWNLVDLNAPELTQRMFSVNAKLTDKGELQGDLKSRFTNHGAFNFRQGFKDVDMDTYLSDLENRYNEIEISNYETSKTGVYEGYVSQSFDFFHENLAEVANDKIYFQPLSFLRLETNPFKLETREYPIDFGFAFRDTYNVNVFIPEGYAIESIPEPTIIKLPNDLGSFKYMISESANRVQLSVTFEISKSFIGPDNYLILKEYFNQVIKKEAEQIVLTKA